MTTRHSQIITLSDDYRANVSLVPAILVSGFLVIGLGLNPIGGAQNLSGVAPSLIGIFLIAWPLYALIYLLWTHIGLQELSETELVVHARWISARSQKWWARWLSNGGAVSWTMLAAFLAILLNIVLATSVTGEEPSLAAGLGLGNVIASWAVMVYSFALEYLRLDLRDGGSERVRQLEFDVSGPRSFGDYLTFSVLASTMAAALPGKATTSASWTLVRSNIIVAFAFNSVVVATLVSMILSYLMQ